MRRTGKRTTELRRAQSSWGQRLSPDYYCPEKHSPEENRHQHPALIPVRRTEEKRV